MNESDSPFGVPPLEEQEGPLWTWSRRRLVVLVAAGAATVALLAAGAGIWLVGLAAAGPSLTVTCTEAQVTSGPGWMASSIVCEAR